MALASPGSDVIIGKDGYLFLGGGKHSPALFAQGQRLVKPESIRNFWRNIQRRSTALDRRGIPYLHLIAPDKHSVCSDVYPETITTLLGKQYLDAALNTELSSLVKYPVHELSRNIREHCYQVDTHYRPKGTSIMIEALLDHFDAEAAKQLLQEKINGNVRSVGDWAGDLGSKCDPVKTEQRLQLSSPATCRKFSNELKGGNNGIIDLYVNVIDNGLPLGRVMLFGDSFGRDMGVHLSHIAREVLFLRTPFCHIDLVDAAKPSLVITQCAERYLSKVVSDEERPVFLLYPFMKDQAYHMSPKTAEALSVFLSATKPGCNKLINLLNSKQALENPA